MLLGCRAARVTHARAQVALNKGLDFVPLDGVLLELRLPPEALEVPVPRCLLEARASVRHRPPCSLHPRPAPHTQQPNGETHLAQAPDLCPAARLATGPEELQACRALLRHHDQPTSCVGACPG